MNPQIRVCKCDVNGRLVWAYPGTILEQDRDGLLLEASFDRERVDLGLLVLVRGDRFLERYYFDRWYNIFTIYDGQNAELKGWYCNVARPAVLAGGELRADDLALDLLVLPDGRMQLLDEDEFRSLGITIDDRRAARRGLDELRRLIDGRQSPFESSLFA
jgi:predicted RNA-binding protein associated with RNAse of E/G family